MSKTTLIFLLSVFLILSCSKKDAEKIQSEPTAEEMVVIIYEEAVEALKKGDSFYVPPNTLHGALCIEAGELIDVFSPIREDFM